MRAPAERYPGHRAPSTGVYIAHNVLGTPTEMKVLVREGEPLPVLPRGFMWRLTPRPPVRGAPVKN
jgi:hypothetical protein